MMATVANQIQEEVNCFCLVVHVDMAQVYYNNSLIILLTSKGGRCNRQSVNESFCDCFWDGRCNDQHWFYDWKLGSLVTLVRSLLKRQK